MEPVPFDMDVEDLARLRATGAPHQVLDVREPWETEICGLPDALLIPLGTLPGRLDEVPDDVPVIVLCHHGARSARAVGLLRSRGVAGAVNLRGGIDAWASRIDTTMARYD
jgi:rhodanese-related sulfurtransferase